MQAMWEHPPHESAEYCSELGTAALLPEPERHQFDWRGSDDEHGNHDDRLLDLRFHAARPAASVRRHTHFSDSSRTVRLRTVVDSAGYPVAAEKIARRGRIANFLSGDRFTIADRPQRPSLRRHSHHSEHTDIYVCFVPGRVVHGHDNVLRADVPHGDAAGVFRVSEFAARASELRGVSYRSGGRVVRQIEIVRGAPGLCRNV